MDAEQEVELTESEDSASDSDVEGLEDETLGGSDTNTSVDVSYLHTGFNMIRPFLAACCKHMSRHGY